jgi:hypothetical protein
MTLAALPNPNLKAICLEAAVAGCEAEVYLNDIPLGRIGGDGLSTLPDRFGMTVSDYVVNGPNRMELLLFPGDRPSRARAPREAVDTAGVRAWIRLAEYDPGMAIGDGGYTLHEIYFDGDRGEMPAPISLADAVSVSSQFAAPWAWEGAEPLVMTGALVGEATRFVEHVWAVMDARDVPGQNALSDLNVREGCVAYGTDFRATRAEHNAMLGDIFGDPTFAMRGLDHAAFDFRLCANGRLVECVGVDWRPVVRSEPDRGGTVMRVPLLIGRVQGRMAWLR